MQPCIISQAAESSHPSAYPKGGDPSSCFRGGMLQKVLLEAGQALFSGAVSLTGVLAEASCLEALGRPSSSLWAAEKRATSEQGA